MRLKFKKKYAADLIAWSMATAMAFVVRFDGALPSNAIPGLLALTLATVPLKAVVVARLGLNQQSWRKISFRDLRLITLAVGGVAIAELVFALIIRNWFLVPRSVPLIAGLIALVAMFGIRALRRFTYERHLVLSVPDDQRKQVLVVGAGEAGSMLAREMVRHADSGLEPVGFVDDDPSKRGLSIAGAPVYGGVDMLPGLLERGICDEVLIAVPSADGRFIREVIGMIDASEHDVPYRVIPGIYELLAGDVSVSRIRDVRVEDLLRRAPVELDLCSIGDYVDDEVVLVTGAAGSIGSEIVRQLSLFRPGLVVLLDKSENSIYEIDRELASTFRELAFETTIGDVRDADRLRTVFERHRPSVVFHAAAHKHVPLMEANPEEAFLNNVLGTRNLVELAVERDVKRFVNISTDKAVNPSSVMGRSKRLAECVVQDAARRAAPDQRFVSVRFGNVLGSRGSVVPLFRQQIDEGGPVTVTHQEMTRYFMTIPEASQLVLQAGALAQNGSVYLLDMGEPVRIMDLAEDLIRLSGLEPHLDVAITITGTRPGEKIHEELMTAGELSGVTEHAKIFQAQTRPLEASELSGMLAAAEEAARMGDTAAVRSHLEHMVLLAEQGSPQASRIA